MAQVGKLRLGRASGCVHTLGMSEYGCFFFFFFGDVKLISVPTGVAPTGPTPKNDSLKLILMNRLSL